MRKILVIDDEADIVDLVKGRLEASGYAVISAFDGNEGIALARQQKPDLIMMDIMMPQLSGGDTVRILKAETETKHIPIVFLTAMTSHMPKGVEAKRINVDGQYYSAIAKPFESNELMSEIKKQLGES